MNKPKQTIRSKVEATLKEHPGLTLMELAEKSGVARDSCSNAIYNNPRISKVIEGEWPRAIGYYYLTVDFKENALDKMRALGL